MSVSEHAVFACEFAGGGGDKRRSGGRKSSVSVWISASEFALYRDGNKSRNASVGALIGSVGFTEATICRAGMVSFVSMISRSSLSYRTQ